ncbi:hypothetical protein GCM10020256_62000 [Streptomyces thermocoprophilus]
MCEPAEEPSGLGERCRVAGPSGEDRGVRERGGGGGLGGLGDGEDRRAGPGQRLETGLPVHCVDEYGGVEADGAAAALPRAPPAGGDLAGGGGEGAAGQQPVPVGDMVADLGGGQHQGDGRSEPGALSVGDGRGAHAAQRAGSGLAASGGGVPGLSLRQDRYEKPVIVRRNSGELPVVLAEREAEPAQMCCPLRGEPLSEPVSARPDDPEHITPRSPVRPARHPDAAKNHISLTVSSRLGHDPWDTWALDGSAVHQYRHKPPRGDYPLGAPSASWMTIGMRNARKTAVRGGVHGIGAQGECLAWPRRRQR